MRSASRVVLASVVSLLAAGVVLLAGAGTLEPGVAPSRPTGRAALADVVEPTPAPLVRPASPSAPSRPAAPPREVAPPHPRRVSLAMGGDLLWHNTVWQSAAADHAVTGVGRRFDFDPMLAAVKPWFDRSDLALCHEEVPFALPGQPLASFPVFAAPPEVAHWIASFGFDACTTASNHAVDGGWEGLRHTADLLARNGVEHVGTFRSRTERGNPVILTSDDGVRVGVVAGAYGLNGFSQPEGRPWAVSMWDAGGLLRQARRAREAGADIVVVHLHGGNEYDHLPNIDQTGLVYELTRSPDVDLVLGEHAHVVQPITRVNGKWVVYGMGNLVAQSEADRPSAYQGITVRFTFAETASGRFRVRKAEYQPVSWGFYSAASPIRVRPATGAAREQIRADVHALGFAGGLIER